VPKVPKVIGHDGVRFVTAPDDFWQQVRKRKKSYKELKKLRKREKKIQRKNKNRSLKI
jgi:hypothetical protein